jgi:hypothetical protein
VDMFINFISSFLVTHIGVYHSIRPSSGQIVWPSLSPARQAWDPSGSRVHVGSSYVSQCDHDIDVGNAGT